LKYSDASLANNNQVNFLNHSLTYNTHTHTHTHTKFDGLRCIWNTFLSEYWD